MARRTRYLIAGIALLALLVPVQVALAAPVTVNLRVEGPSSTLFEAPVTTDVRTFDFSGQSQNHLCDGTAAASGTSSVPVATRGAAISTAIAGGLPATGSFGMFGASFDTIAGASVAYDPSTFSYLAEYLNGAFAQVGACADPIKAGDDVLFAYGDGSGTLLKLKLPATAAPGAAVAGKVTDLPGGSPVAGADVGGATSGADGTVTLPGFTDRGDHTLKATKVGAIRSARAVVCVTDGADGFCNSTKPVTTAPTPTAVAADNTPALTQIAGLREGQLFKAGKAPRTLSGSIASDASGVKDVLLRLTRKVPARAGVKARCEAYNGASERWARASPCGTEGGSFFSIGAKADWSYLLPAALTKGRYVLDIRTVDGAGNVTRGADRGSDPTKPRTRVVFSVG